MGSGITRKYAYDSRSSLTTLLYLDGATAIATFVDTYDGVGDRVGRTQDALSIVWTYDKNYRLTGQQKTGQWATYTYDQVDNLLTKQHQGAAPMTFSYDAAQRFYSMVQGSTGESYMWSPRGALKEVTAPGVVTTFVYEDGTLSLFNVQPSTGARSSYVYDGDNLRRQTREGTVTATMVWDGSDYLAVKRSVGDDSLFVNLDGEAIGELGPSKGRDYIVDPLGSVAGYVDTDGDIRATFEYWPFGEMVNLPEDGEGPLLWVGSLGYYKDVGSRYYMRAREYEARYATWLQIDPLWPGESAWGYALSSPVKYQDPSGTQVLRCTRDVIGSDINHWAIIVTGDGCKGGARLDYTMGGVLAEWPRERPLPGETCDPVSTSPKQEQCLCKMIKDLQRTPTKPVCGKSWLPSWSITGPAAGAPYDVTLCQNPFSGGGSYNAINHNCQHFVNAAFDDCGVPGFPYDYPKPPDWRDIFPW